MKIADRLGLDAFKIDSKSHIQIDSERCQAACTSRPCLWICPAELYSSNDDDQIVVDHEGCLECGTCLVACPQDALKWRYPSAGQGVCYRLG